MDLDFGYLPEAMAVSIMKYLTKVLNEWPEVLKRTKINPHTDN